MTDDTGNGGSQVTKVARRNLRPGLAVAAAVLGVAFLACSGKIDPRLVRHWAANDFECDDRVVDVERIGDPSRYRARGCGHSRVYDCVVKPDDTVKCEPVAEVAAGGPPPGTEIAPGGCDCSHPHSTDEPSTSPPPATPVMPQKPYRQ